MVKMKKIIALGLAAVLTMTAIPNLSETVAYAADTAWSVLSEKDIVLDDIYNRENNIVIGRKDGKIATLDDKLNLIQQSDYDQIELYAKDGYLVSKKTDTQTDYGVLNTETGKITPFFSGDYDSIEMFYNGEYCYKVKKENKFGLINWVTGKIILPVCYDNIDRLTDDSDTGAVFAVKEDGTSGFICNGKEIGFDTRVSAKDGLLYATSITLDSEVYYVKEFFENGDVYDDMGEFWASSNLKYFKEELESYLAQEKCKLVFYDQEGTVYEGSYILEKVSDLNEQREAVLSKVEEQAQTDTADFISKEYADQNANIDKIVVQQYGNIYVACASICLDDDCEENVLGVYDLLGNLLQFGYSLVGYNIDDVEEEGWEDGILLKNVEKQIYYYNKSGWSKLIYTDVEDKFCLRYYKTTAEDDSIVLYGMNDVLLADPETDFLKIGKKVFGDDYSGIDSDAFNMALLIDNDSERELVFYDYDYNVIKTIDLSGIGQQIYTREYDSSIIVGAENYILFIDKEGHETKISVSENPDFSRIKNVYYAAGETYVYTNANDVYALYRLRDQTKLMQMNDTTMQIKNLYCVDGVNVILYSIYYEDERYYGLMDFNGKIIADAQALKYTYYWTRCSSYDDEKEGILKYICFQDDDENEYYYDKDMSVHTDVKENSDDNTGDGEQYEGITYYKEYLDEGGREEKVCDSNENVLVSCTVTEDELEQDGYKKNIYIFPNCRSVVFVKKHWDGKRIKEEGGEPTTIPSAAPEATPSAAPDVTPDVTPTVTPIVMPSCTPAVKPIITPDNTPDVSPKATPDVTSNIAPTALPTALPDVTSDTPSQEGKNLSKPVPARAQFKKIKNVKGRKIKITLKAAKNASGYQIAYAVGKSFKKKSTVTSKKLTVTLKKLKKKTYYVKVRAFVTQDGKKVYGKWSSVKKVKIKK